MQCFDIPELLPFLVFAVDFWFFQLAGILVLYCTVMNCTLLYNARYSTVLYGHPIQLPPPNVLLLIILYTAQWVNHVRKA